jgi:hypothetical protein
MCTYSHCILSAKTFGDKKLWWDHETERHRVQRAWICSPCEQQQRESVYKSSAAFDEHVNARHEVELPPAQLETIRDMCQKDIGRSQPSNLCPLCQEIIPRKGKKSLDHSIRKHVADHLEQLAFFVAVPAGQMLVKDDDSEFQDDSDSEDDQKSEIKSVISKNTHLSKRELHLANVQHFIADQQKLAHNPDTAATSSHLNRQKEQQQGVPRTQTTTGSTKSDSVEVPKFPLLSQVPPPNEHFYCRHGRLPEIDKVLQTPGSICVLRGMGGVGKTLTAVEYLHTHRDKYDAIFWLQADTAPGLADSYLQLARALGVATSAEDHHQVIARGAQWLQGTGLFCNSVSPNIAIADLNRAPLATHL